MSLFNEQYNQIISEIFGPNEAFPLNWTEKSDDFWECNFETKKSGRFEVTIIMELPGKWEIIFAAMKFHGENEYGENEYIPQLDPTNAKTGEELLIYGSVINAAREFMTQMQPPMIFFTNDKTTSPKRTKLYHALAKKISTEFPNYKQQATGLRNGKDVIAFVKVN
jgi:hypothetical protein